MYVDRWGVTSGGLGNPPLALEDALARKACCWGTTMAARVAGAAGAAEAAGTAGAARVAGVAGVTGVTGVTGVARAA
jgi:hypothetical protein